MSLRSWAQRRLLFFLAGTMLIAVVSIALMMLHTSRVNFLTAPVRRGHMQVLVQATGKIEAAKSVSVGAQVSGQITALHVTNGSLVERGQIIAEIDDSNQLNELRIAQAELRVFNAQHMAKVAALKKTTLTYQRQKNLWYNNAISRKAYEESEADLAIARAGIDELDALIVQANIKVDKAKVNLSYTRVVAPVSGTVVAVFAREGQTVNAVHTAPIIVKLAELDMMTVKTQISEADITRIAPKQPLFFTILAEPDNPYYALLRTVEQAPDNLTKEEYTTHTNITNNSAVYYNALFDVPNPDHRLRINMTAQVSLIVDDVKDTLLIPAAALTHSDGNGNYTLQVLMKGKPVKRQVKIGLNNFVDAQVLSGLQAVSRSYGYGDAKVDVLRDIHLRINPGEMVAIIGSSGSGKSTLMNIMGCLDRPSSGEYRIRGHNVANFTPDMLAALRCKFIGFIFQRYHLIPALNVINNIEIPAVYANRPRQERRLQAKALLARLGLIGKHHHLPAQLSGGQQQRVGIARALMNGGSIILADEPTGALDSTSTREVLTILKDLNQQGHTLIIVTHDMAVAKHARRIVEIRDGYIVADACTDRAPLPPPLLPCLVKPNLRHKCGAKVADRVRESLHMALKAIYTHRMRTILTMAGIVFGIAAVVTVVGLGEGAREQTLRRINFLGTNVISIYPGKDFFDESAGDIHTLVAADVSALANQCYVNSVSPELRTSASLRYRNKSANVDVIGVGENYFRIRGLSLTEGQPFTFQQVVQATPDAIIDDNARRTLFVNIGQSPIGQTLLLNKMTVRVIGVAVADTNVTESRSDHIHIWLPYTTILHRIMGQQYINGIVVRTGDGINNAAAERAIEQLMLQRHGVKDFMLFNNDKIRRSVMKTSMTFSILIAMVAMIALFIGSLGVMNIMLVSVTERTYEIGIRMAVGARCGDIMQQFLIEAVLICLTGGILGVLLAVSSSALFNAFAGDVFQMLTSWPTAAGAFLCSCAIGIVFGYWPARNASHLNPIEALSRE